MKLAIREIGHFVAWTFPVYLAQVFCDYFLDSAAIGFFLWWTLPKALGLLLIYWTIRAECYEMKEGMESRGKFVLDMVAKLGGLGVSLATAGWWREWL